MLRLTYSFEHGEKSSLCIRYILTELYDLKNYYSNFTIKDLISYKSITYKIKK